MYLALKTLHILSSTILFGTGIGIAYFMWSVRRSGSRPALVVVTRQVMRADLLFTTPAVIVQPLSGFGLMAMAGHSMTFTPPNWLGLSLMLYLVAGACWLPVLRLQARMHRLAAQAPGEPDLPEAYLRQERTWVLLGISAFCSLVVVFWLMTAKPF